jgi:peptide/nickel transport system permease protein
MGPVIVAGTYRRGRRDHRGVHPLLPGAGLPARHSHLGPHLYDAKDYLDVAPHWALFPGTAIFLTVLSINYLGDGLRDALDPRKVM